MTACGDDDDGEASAGNVASETEGATSEATGSASAEDLNLTAADLTVECLAPQPLDEPTTIKVGTSALLEFFVVPLLAQELGELEAENLSVEYELVPPVDSKQLVANGDLDVAVTAADQPMFNLAASGVDYAMILPNQLANDDSDGLMARRDIFSDPENPDISELEGLTAAFPGGINSGSGFVTDLILREGGLTVDDIDVIDVPVPDLFTSLETGAADMAFMYPPFLAQAQATGDYVRLGGLPQEYSLVGYQAGPNLLNGDPEVGTAFVRAILRTQVAHLDEDYRSDPEVVAALAKVMELDDPSSLTQGLPIDYSYGFDTAMFDEPQEFYLSREGQLNYDEPLAFEDLTDTRFYEAAVEPCR
jgi:NitT/TauT family transport system substrate-binding protein